MAMLRLNGITLPILAETMQVVDSAGGSGGADRRAIDGTSIPDRTWLRRVISFKTPPLTSDDARAFRLLCAGIGINFPFDASSGSAGKGLLTSSGSFTYYTGAAARQIGTSGVYAPAIGNGTPAYIPGAGTMLGGGCTINYWVQQSATSFTTPYVNVGSTTFTSRQTTATDIALVTNIGGSLTTLSATPAWGSAGSWHMVTATLRFNTLAGLPIRSLYFDGALIASDSPAVSASAIATMQTVGNVAVAAHSDNKVSDALVLPYAINASMVSQHYASNVRWPNSPLVTLDGEALNDGAITCLGSTSHFGAMFTPCFIGGTYRTDAQSLAIVLEEV